MNREERIEALKKLFARSTPDAQLSFLDRVLSSVGDMDVFAIAAEYGVETVKATRRINCPYCAAKPKSKEDLERHVRVHHSTRATVTGVRS